MIPSLLAGTLLLALTAPTWRIVAPDVSEYQRRVNGLFNRYWLIFRIGDGTYVDRNFDWNYSWSLRNVARRRPLRRTLRGYTGYWVWEPGLDGLVILRGLLPHADTDEHLVLAVDLETWPDPTGTPRITGDHSDELNDLFERLARWVGRHRVILYGNAGDIAELFPRRASWIQWHQAKYSDEPPTDLVCGWQYTDGDPRWPVPTGLPRSSAPFGRCDHNVFPFATADELAAHFAAPKRPPAVRPSRPVRPPRRGPKLYTVRAGDTLSEIEARFHLSRRRLYRLNAARHPYLSQHPNRILAGWRIRVR